MLVRQLQKNLVKENKYNRVEYVYIQLYFYVFMTTQIDINQVGRGVTVDISQEIVTANTPELITTTGAGTWTKPAGVTRVLVECWGGGASGGEAAAAASNNSSGGGGAGGQYARKLITYSQAQQSISYTVAPLQPGLVPSNGNDTIWDSNVVVARGGQSAESNGVTGNPAPGGVGSTFGGVGDVVYKGGSGTFGTTGQSGAGGGGAGSTGDGNDAVGTTGGAGKDEFGGNGGNGVTSPSDGISATNYGGGGGGGAKTTTIDRSGGDGAQGLIRITTYNISQRRGVPIQSV